MLIPYQPDVQQGNIITEKMISQLKIGMTPEAAQQVMGGKPVLINVFPSESIIYVYTYKPGKAKMSQKKVELKFKDKQLIDINTSGFSQNK